MLIGLIGLIFLIETISLRFQLPFFIISTFNLANYFNNKAHMYVIGLI